MIEHLIIVGVGVFVLLIVILLASLGANEDPYDRMY